MVETMTFVGIYVGGSNHSLGFLGRCGAKWISISTIHSQCAELACLRKPGEGPPGLSELLRRVRRRCLLFACFGVRACSGNSPGQVGGVDPWFRSFGLVFFFPGLGKPVHQTIQATSWKERQVGKWLWMDRFLGPRKLAEVVFVPMPLLSFPWSVTTGERALWYL